MFTILSFLCRFENPWKLLTSNKRILSRKSFTAKASVFHSVGMTKYQKWSLPILLNWCKLQLLWCLLTIQSVLFQFNNPSKHEAFNNRVICSKSSKAIASLVYLFKYCKLSFLFFKNYFELQLLELSFTVPSILHWFKNPSKRFTFNKRIISGKSSRSYHQWFML